MNGVPWYIPGLIINIQCINKLLCDSDSETFLKRGFSDNDVEAGHSVFDQRYPARSQRGSSWFRSGDRAWFHCCLYFLDIQRVYFKSLQIGADFSSLVEVMVLLKPILSNTRNQWMIYIEFIYKATPQLCFIFGSAGCSFCSFLSSHLWFWFCTSLISSYAACRRYDEISLLCRRYYLYELLQTATIEWNQ